MKKICFWLILAATLVLPARAAITVTPGGGGSVSSNDVWQIIQDIGVGGGIVSNYVIPLNGMEAEAFYTNNTEYYVGVNAIVTLPNAAIMEFQVWTNVGDVSPSYMRRVVQDTAEVITSGVELGGIVPAGGKWRYQSVGAGAAVIDDTAPTGTELVYYGVGGSGGGSGTVQTNTHWGATTNLTDRLNSFAATNQVPGSNITGTVNASTITTTNLHTGITNAPALATDANGKLTNGVAGVTGARHVKSRDFYHMWDAINSNRPVRFLLVGDSVSDANETTRGVRYALDNYMERGGFGTWFTENQSEGPDPSPLHFYQSGTAGFVYVAGYAPGYYFAFENGEVSTWQSDVTAGIPANDLAVYYMGGAELGSFLVETQINGGSWGSLATIDSTAAGQGVLTATNFTLAATTNYNLRFTSTGSNNIWNAGLSLKSNATNYQTWAKVAVAGALVTTIVTNAGFYTFLTNYNPHVVIVEAKDSAATSLEALTWLNSVCTNRDLIIVANSPNLPDAGAAADRELKIAFAQTNNLNLFDKYGLLLPTNYWPTLGTAFWADGAHLGYNGISYVSSAFSDWMGLGAERFAMAGLPTPEAAASSTTTNTIYWSATDVRAFASGSLQTTEPSAMNDVYNLTSGGGSSFTYLRGHRLVSGTLLSVEGQAVGNEFGGKTNLIITQYLEMTNSAAYNYTNTLEVYAVGYATTDLAQRYNSSAISAVYTNTVTGTNLTAYTRTLSMPSWATNGAFIIRFNAGANQQSVWWTGAKIESYNNE